MTNEELKKFQPIKCIKLHPYVECEKRTPDINEPDKFIEIAVGKIFKIVSNPTMPFTTVHYYKNNGVIHTIGVTEDYRSILSKMEEE